MMSICPALVPASPLARTMFAQEAGGPEWLSLRGPLEMSVLQWIELAGVVVGALLAGTVLQWIVTRSAAFISSRTPSSRDEEVLATLPGPLGLFLVSLLTYLAVPFVKLPDRVAAGIEQVISCLFIASVTWFLWRLVKVAARFIEARMIRGVEDESRQRAIHTQITIPLGLARSLVVLLGAALIAMQFEVVRSVGVSLLASAGLAGAILAFAAQRTVANLFAGLQLAFLQPIKIGDVVVVEGEWGWIEQIGFSHVVVKIWDLRRLVLPVSYFLERPFQNWTMQSADLLGTVYLFTDFDVSVDGLRAELDRILKNTDLWDGRVQGVSVTGMSNTAVEVRVLVSARDGGTMWDLRCHVRERLLVWLQEHGLPHLPLQRVELETGAPARE